MPGRTGQILIDYDLLLGLLMNSCFSAERTILLDLHTIRVVLLVLNSIVVSVLALCAFQDDFNSHAGSSVFTNQNSEP